MVVQRVDLPKSRLAYWSQKIEANKARDRRTVAALEGLGWKVLVVWQCDLRDPVAAMKTLSCFLGRI
jgi:DNA mismatch endonuclease Vsr